MAAIRDRGCADYSAAVVLALCVATHYGWSLAPPEHQAQAWNILGAFARLCLLAALLWYRRGIILWVGAWWALEELQVIGCSAAFIISPWVVAPGDSQCSALLGFDLGKVGATVIAFLLLSILTGGAKGRSGE